MQTAERDRALRVAKLLVEKGKVDEAVGILAAWACSGPNDEEGQALLAEALRIAPGSPLAKMAFERMEGLPGDHGLLDEAIRRFDLRALDELERQHKPAVFRKAQVGFNNNVQYRSATYHVQTEDSGLERPHVITHLFADGGRVIKSHKRSYAAEVQRSDVAAYVRGLMKAQHMEMCILLREGEFDEVIAGRSSSSKIQVLDFPPRARVKRGAGEAVGPTHQKSSRPPPGVGAPCRVRLVAVRCLWNGPEAYEPHGDEIVLGSKGDVALTGERFTAPREAVLRFADGKLSLVDLEGGNGVFVRIRNPVELVFGDEFMVGDQLLRLENNPESDDGPDPGPTYFYASPRWLSSFRVVQHWEGGTAGATCVAKANTVVQIGRVSGDLWFPTDPLVSDPHCVLEEQAGAIVLSDLDSRAGTFVRVTGEREVFFGDEITIGRTRLRIDAPGRNSSP